VARIELVRSGGFAGRTLRAAVDTSTDPDATWYAETLSSLDLASLSGADRGRPAPDRFHYSLSVEDDDGAAHRLDFAETAVPEQLRPLVDRLVSRASGAQP
jgi:hypothetical protein